MASVFPSLAALASYWPSAMSVPTQSNPKSPVANYSLPYPSEQAPFNTPVFHVRQTQYPGMSHPWFFLDHHKVKAGVLVIPVVETPKGPVVELLTVQRPTLGGPLTLELPCGGWGDEDPNETLEDAARRELKQETGYDATVLKPLTETFFSVTAGISNELRRMFIAKATGSPSDALRDEDEKLIIQGRVQVPLGVFLNDQKFYDWIQEQGKHYVVPLDTLAARSLLIAKGRRLMNLQA